jgi:hypothetical protein
LLFRSKALKDLHFQQATVQMAIAQLEQLRTRSPWVTPWPWITIMALALIVAQAFGDAAVGTGTDFEVNLGSDPKRDRRNIRIVSM